MLKAFEEFKKQYQGKKVLILGLGLQGRGVGDARFFTEIGTKVTVTDLKTEKELRPSLKKLQGLDIQFILGRHRRQDVLNADLIIRNASVPLDSPYLELARKKNISIEMDDSLFARFCPWPIIGVTGTRGKTTTATLIYELLKGSGKTAFLAGNIYGRASLLLLKKIHQEIKDGRVVLELSSWQLQAWHQARISPQIGVITNIYPDHLNFYQNIEEYINDKKAILIHQKKNDYAVLNQDDARVMALAKTIVSKRVYFDKKSFPSDWSLKLPGEHNLYNAAAAYQVGKLLSLRPQTMKAVFATFRGVAFRLEKIGEIKGIEFINDSTSTIPEATIAALKTFDCPIILIAGGSSKNLSMKPLAQTIVTQVKALILLKGEGTDQLKKELKELHPGIKSIPGWRKKLVVGTFASLKEAVIRAYEIARPGEVILFSPACASFGMFVNEFDRGQQFNRIFFQIKANEN